jgi:hypothetical protein
MERSRAEHQARAEGWHQVGEEWYCPGCPGFDQEEETEPLSPEVGYDPYSGAYDHDTDGPFLSDPFGESLEE